MLSFQDVSRASERLAPGVTTRRDAALDELEAALGRIPEGFRDDGCSSAPDRLFGVNLRPACRAHDHAYCTRAWPAGALDQAHRDRADRLLGASVRALLPFFAGWLGWWYFSFVHRFGGDAAFDSCGRAGGDRCRHDLPKPAWMLGP